MVKALFLAVQRKKTAWKPLWDHVSQEAKTKSWVPQKNQRIIIKSNHPNSATKPHIMLLVMIYVHIIIPWNPKWWSLLTILSPVIPIVSIYGCRNIMLYPYMDQLVIVGYIHILYPLIIPVLYPSFYLSNIPMKKSQDIPLTVGSLPKTKPHGRRSLTIWTCYWTRRGLGMGVFFLGKTW